MNQRMRTGYIVSAAALSLATALAAGCGGKSDEEVAAHATKSAATAVADKAAAAAARARQEEDDRLANAVATGKSSAPVDLKYDIAAKPVSGQPFEVELTFLPRASADSLDVEISAVEGLTLVGGGIVKFNAVQAGERYTTKLLLQSGADGMYYIGVATKMVTKIQTEVRNFSVPIVVGSPAAAEKPAPEKDAAGKAVEPMSAVESNKN
jgi:hypothetical protein